MAKRPILKFKKRVLGQLEILRVFGEASVFLLGVLRPGIYQVLLRSGGGDGPTWSGRGNKGRIMKP